MVPNRPESHSHANQVAPRPKESSRVGENHYNMIQQAKTIAGNPRRNPVSCSYFFRVDGG